MTQEAYIDILEIEANQKADICSLELQNVKASLHNIERETSAAKSHLCTWIASHTSHQAGNNEEHAAAIETKDTTLAKYPQPYRDGDTKGVNKEDKKVDNDVPCESRGCQKL